MYLLITGTDTGVGKTFITYNLALALKEKGIKVACFKPVETGVKDIPEDGKLLSSATGQPLEEVVPFRYKLPLSPYAGYLEEGWKVDLEQVKSKFFDLKGKYEVVLVEGAGGIAVPIVKDYDYSDLAKDLDLEVLIVARAGLGTLNHTFLTCFYVQRKGLKIKGIVLNRFTGKDVSERTNPTIISERLGIEPIKIRESYSGKVSQEEKKALLDLVGL